MKYFEKRWIYTDGIIAVTITGLRNAHFHGVTMESKLGEHVIGFAQYRASAFGSFGAAKEYAMKDSIYCSRPKMKLIKKEIVQ